MLVDSEIASSWIWGASFLEETEFPFCQPDLGVMTILGVQVFTSKITRDC
jgi:hypothetical protein